MAQYEGAEAIEGPVMPSPPANLKGEPKFLGIPLSELDPDVEFPREDVANCQDRKLDPMKFNDGLPCPKCNKRSDKLYWLKFRSPPSTWMDL